jgi:hypothetical protein
VVAENLDEIRRVIGAVHMWRQGGSATPYSRPAWPSERQPALRGELALPLVEGGTSADSAVRYVDISCDSSPATLHMAACQRGCAPQPRSLTDSTTPTPRPHLAGLPPIRYLSISPLAKLMCQIFVN